MYTINNFDRAPRHISGVYRILQSGLKGDCMQGHRVKESQMSGTETKAPDLQIVSEEDPQE